MIFCNKAASATHNYGTEIQCTVKSTLTIGLFCILIVTTLMHNLGGTFTDEGRSESKR